MADKEKTTPTTYNAILRGVRMSPRKVRLVVALVRGRSVNDAIDILKVTTKKMAPVITKLVKSAIANAQQNATVDIDRLYIAEAYADGGQMFKRFLPRAQGRGFTIRKRTSHITLKLKEK